MQEPSVLDYVKSKLAFWKQSSIEIPVPEPDAVSSPAAGEMNDSAAAQVEDSRKAWAVSNPLAGSSASSIFLIGLVLSFALLAQGFLEPPNRAAVLGMIAYAVTAAALGLGYFRNLILPSAPPEDAHAPERLSFRAEGFLIGLGLMLLAFITFGTPAGRDVPTFGFFNTVVWLLSIGYLVWAFYQPEKKESLRARLAKVFFAPSWKITLTRFGMLLLAATALVLFFRFYRLDGVPAEMFSDHAEKLLDVNDVLNGELRVFFPRNTGREAFQFYWTALMSRVFNVGISFMALKLGTVLGSLLALYYIYRIGTEIGNRWVALLALLFCGFSYWANIQARIGLRFPLYPMFYAPVLFHLIRGLRSANRNDFIWAGLWLGLGLHGYTAYRIVPLVLVAGFVIYALHHRSARSIRFAFAGLVILALISLAVFIPLARFSVDNWDAVVFRSMTRLSDWERPLPGPVWLIFIQNTWRALTMFFWDNGDVWVHSIPHRPALDVISAALLFTGGVLITLRYIRKRSWIDLFMLVSIPMLLLPSIMSLAFPNENPNLNRTAGAYVPIFLIVAVGLEALLSSLKRHLPARLGTAVAAGLGLILIGLAASNNFDLLFNQYDRSFRSGSWNSSEMGAVIRSFDEFFGRAEDAWVVAYPHWVDTRLVGMNAGFPTRDTAISVEQIPETAGNPRAKLFLVNLQDSEGLNQLIQVYPDGRYWVYDSKVDGKDFLIYLVAPEDNVVPTDLGAASQ